MAISRFRYDDIVNGKPVYCTIGKIDIQTYVPSPTKGDYTRGYFRRFFIQKINDSSSPIYEVSQKTYTQFLRNQLYLNSVIEWKISGSDDEIKKANSVTLINASKRMVQLGMYLTNFTQFSQNNLVNSN